MGKKGKRGAEAFDEYYGAVYGRRWAALRQALALPGTPVPFNGKLTKPYRLDSSSIEAALALLLPVDRPSENDGTSAIRILDMCAAPGGKTLVLASSMPDSARLTANERSAERRFRLARVVAEHLPPHLAAAVAITGRDAASLCRRESGHYDRILLDAPCSSERHVLASPVHLGRWTPARTKNLALSQWGLLSSAFIMLKPGGILVYCTCSISPLENDGVVERLLKKHGSKPTDYPPAIAALPADSGEPTRYGRLILPDVRGGSGPMYICRIRKADA